MKKVLLPTALIALIALTGCIKEKGLDTPRKDHAVRFKTSITGHNLVTRVNDTEWENDEIGIYMVDASGLFEDLHEANKLHTAASNGALNPSSGHEIFYPEGGETVYFVAYHPYVAGVEDEDHTVSLDVTDQADQSALDFMYAKTAEDRSEGEVELVFDHELVKLVFNLTDADATLEGVSAVLKGFNTLATFNLDDAADPQFVLDGDSEADIDAWVSSESEDAATLEFIVLPQDVENPMLEITLADGSTVDYDFGGEAVFAGNHKYTYDLTLVEGDNVATGSASINGWGEPEEGDVVATLPKTPYTPSLPFDFDSESVFQIFSPNALEGETENGIGYSIAEGAGRDGISGALAITGTGAADGDGFTITFAETLTEGSLVFYIKGSSTIGNFVLTYNDDSTHSHHIAGYIASKTFGALNSKVTYNTLDVGLEIPNWAKVSIPISNITKGINELHIGFLQGGEYDLLIDDMSLES